MLWLKYLCGGKFSYGPDKNQDDVHETAPQENSELPRHAALLRARALYRSVH
jgi:hypothetical protein